MGHHSGSVDDVAQHLLGCVKQGGHRTLVSHVRLDRAA